MSRARVSKALFSPCTSGLRFMSVDWSQKISSRFMQYIFQNPVNRLEKHSFEKSAFKVREHRIALVKKLLCKIKE